MMNRRGSREQYLELVARLRREVEGIAIRSTFIAGFPTETEQDVEGLCDFLNKAKLTNCGFFAYSREPDTPAYKIKGQIAYAEKNRRVKKLYAVQRQVRASFCRALRVKRSEFFATASIMTDSVLSAGHIFRLPI